MTTTQDKKKIYQARTIAALQMDRHVGDEFTVEDIIQFETTRADSGEPATSTVIFTTEGKVYSTLSPTVDDSVKNLDEIFGAEVAGLKLKIINGVSNSGNKFLQLDIV